MLRCLPILFLLAACTPPPDLPPPPEAAVAPPALVPLGPILAEAGSDGTANPEAELAARMAELQARATGLRVAQ